MIKILDFTLLFLYCLFIYWLSDQTTLPVPQLFSFQDKIFHAGAYFIMGVLAWRSFKHLLTKPIILALLSVTFCSLYGMSDEWHQSFVEGRFRILPIGLPTPAALGWRYFCCINWVSKDSHPCQ